MNDVDEGYEGDDGQLRNNVDEGNEDQQRNYVVEGEEGQLRNNVDEGDED